MTTTASKRSFDIFQGLADMVVKTDINGGICMANNVFCLNFDIGADELKGNCKLDQNLITDILGNHQLLDKIQTHFEEISDTPIRIEVRVVTVEGFRWQEWIFTLNRENRQEPFMLGMGRDITERKMALDRIIQSEKETREMIDGIPSIVLSLNRQKMILDCNEQLEKQLRYSKMQVIGNHINSLLHPDSLVLVCAAMNEAINIRAQQVSECQLLRRDGTVLEVLFSCMILTDGYNHISRTVCTFMDASSLRQFSSRQHQLQSSDQEIIRRKDIALKELLGQMDEQKHLVSRDVQANIDRLLLPMIHKMEDKLDPTNRNRLEMIKNSLLDITDPLTNRLDSKFKNLSPREIEVCSLMTMGLSSKQIAGMLNVSVYTIHNQRRSIRKKLGLVDKDINLTTYLAKLNSAKPLPASN